MITWLIASMHATPGLFHLQAFEISLMDSIDHEFIIAGSLGSSSWFLLRKGKQKKADTRRFPRTAPRPGRRV